MTWLVDAHVHYHACFGWSTFLAGAVRNTLHASRSSAPIEAVDTGPLGVACLLLADPEGVDSLAAFGTGSPGNLPGWRMRRLAGGGVDMIRAIGHASPTRELRLVLLPGRQIRTRERLELLALDCTRPIPDGLPLRAALDLASAEDAVCVLPWGFGKWWGERGRIVEAVLRERWEVPIHLGDNGNRPSPYPAPRLLDTTTGPPLGWNLPGSDPLPFPDHAGRAASCGFLLPGEPDPEHPGVSLRAALAALKGNPPLVAHRRSAPAFAADQLRMQLARRGE
jgi:hypothetical protein